MDPSALLSDSSGMQASTLQPSGTRVRMGHESAFRLQKDVEMRDHGIELGKLGGEESKVVLVTEGHGQLAG
jgi:hypothetical protein